MSQLFLSTTGNAASVTLNDLAGIQFTHPVTNYPLLKPDGNLEVFEIIDSTDLQAAIADGNVTITDQQGNVIADVTEDAANDVYVKVSVNDTTPGTLQDKLISNSISFTVLNTGGNEQLSLGVTINASDVNFDNTNSTINQTTVQGFLDALETLVLDNSSNITDIQNSEGAANGIATLDSNGKVPTSQLPNIAISEVSVVADIPSRDALTVQEGDIAKVTSETKTYIYDGTNWVEISADGNVQSVNSQIGSVQLDAVDIPFNNTNSGLSATELQAAVGELDGRIDTVENSISTIQSASHAAVTIAADGVSDDALSISAGQVITASLATQTTDGLISSADKAKLDGIAANANNYTHPNHSGDVVSSGDGATSIQPNVVSNGKLADMPTGTIKGRASAGTGDPENLTAAQVRSIINVENNAKDDQSASEVPFSNTISGLTATNLQDAVDEIDSRTATLESNTHVPASAGNDSITVNGSQAISVNLDQNSNGGNNAIELVPGEGLYVNPTAVTGSTDLTVESRNANTLSIASSTGNPAVVPPATTSLAGLLTGTDKVKLDSVESSAKDDQNASEVPYDSINSGLTATNVNTAIDEVENRVDSLETSSHSAVSLSTNTATQDGSSLSGQELTLNAASNTSFGLLSPSDKSKLDAVESNAKDDQNASEVPFNNTQSSLTATQVQAAIDELDVKVDTLTTSSHSAVTLSGGIPTQNTASLSGQELTLSAATTSNFGVMSPADKNKLDSIESGATADQTALEVPYDGTSSGLSAANTQSAIDELDGRLDTVETTSHDDVTLASNTTTSDSLNLNDQVLSVNAATINSAGVMSAVDKGKLNGIELNATADQSASEVSYNNANSGLTATNVKDAIDEVTTVNDALKTISGLPFYMAGSESNQNNSVFLRNATRAFTNQVPYIIASTGKIAAITAYNRNNTTTGWDAEVYLNGTVIQTLTVASGTYKNIVILSSPIAISADDEISMRFVNTNGRVRNPTVLVYYTTDA